MEYPSSVASTTVTATPQDPAATLTLSVNGVDVADPTAPISLAEGDDTTIAITVVSSDTTVTKVYTVVVTREEEGQSSNANLEDLVLDAGDISPDFDAGTFAYTLTVPFGTETTTVAATVEESSATYSITVDGNPVSDPTAPIALTADGDTVIAVVVTAEAGNQQTYTVTVTRYSVFHAEAIALNNSTGGNLRTTNNGDMIVLTFSQPVDPDSVGSCGNPIDGTDSDEDLLFTDVSGGDVVTGDGDTLNIGTIAITANNVVTADDTASNSTCVWNADYTVLTITLAGIDFPGPQMGANRPVTWTPSAEIASALGESIDTGQTVNVTIGNVF